MGNKAYNRAYYWANRDRLIAAACARRKADPEKFKRADQLRHYGITPEQYDALMVEQKCKCAICRRRFDLRKKHGVHVDHDHDTKKVRGLLCGNCNKGLGMFGEHPRYLENARKYIMKHHFGENE